MEFFWDLWWEQGCWRYPSWWRWKREWAIMWENKLTVTKLVWIVKTGTDFEEFQKDFMNLRDWRIERHTKCKAIYRVKDSLHFTYEIIRCGKHKIVSLSPCRKVILSYGRHLYGIISPMLIGSQNNTSKGRELNRKQCHATGFIVALPALECSMQSWSPRL